MRHKEIETSKLLYNICELSKMLTTGRKEKYSYILNHVIWIVYDKLYLLPTQTNPGVCNLKKEPNEKLCMTSCLNF